MSAGVCGKRVGFEEIFGSSPKRSRFSSYGSPSRLMEFGLPADDPISSLSQMFPALDPEFIKSVLNNHGNKVEDARESLSALSCDFVEKTESQCFEVRTDGISADVPAEGTATCSQMLKNEVEGAKDIKQKFDNGNVVNGSEWVDLFVREMMSATSLDNARIRAAKILEAFERHVTDNSRAAEELKLASLKEHLQSLLSNNQILKRAVAIQHERNLEQDGREREAEHLRLMLSQYQEKVRNLELNNYSLKLHLQRAQENSTFSRHFHPDVY